MGTKLTFIWVLHHLLFPVLLAGNTEDSGQRAVDASEKLPHLNKHYKNSRCRSDCIQNFMNVSQPTMDSCRENSDCWMCWDFCEHKETFLCHDELLCFPGCRVSCNHLLQNYNSDISLNVSSIQHYSRTGNVLQWTGLIPTAVYTIYTKKPQKRWRFFNQTSVSLMDISALPDSSQIFIIATDDQNVIEKGIWMKSRTKEMNHEDALTQATISHNVQAKPIDSANLDKWTEEPLEVNVGDVALEVMEFYHNAQEPSQDPLQSIPDLEKSYQPSQHLDREPEYMYHNQNPTQRSHHNGQHYERLSKDQSGYSQNSYQRPDVHQQGTFQNSGSSPYNQDTQLSNPVHQDISQHMYTQLHTQPLPRQPVQRFGNDRQYQPYPISSDRLEERSIKPEMEEVYPLHNVQQQYPNPYIEHGSSQSNDLPKMSKYNANPNHVNQLYPNQKTDPTIETDFEIVHAWNLRVMSQESCPGDSVEVVVKWEPYMQRGRYLLIWSVDDNNKGHTSHAYLLRPEAKLKLSQNSIYTLRVEFHPRRSQNTHFTLPSLVSPEIIVDTRTSNSGDHMHIGVMDPSEPDEVTVARYGSSEIIYITFGAVSTILFLVTIVASLLYFKQRQKKFEEAKDAFVQSLQQAELSNKQTHRPLGVAYSLPTTLNTNSYIPTADNFGPLPSPSPSLGNQHMMFAHHPFTPRMTITPPSLPTIPESPSSGVFFYFPQTTGVQAVSNSSGSPSTVSTGLSCASTPPNADTTNISNQLEKGAEMGLVNTQCMPDGAKKGQKPPPLVLANCNEGVTGQQSPAISMQYFSTSA